MEAPAEAPVVQAAPEEYGVGLPDAEAVRVVIWQALRVLCEAIDGRRPVEQIATLATAPVLRHVRVARACQCRGQVTRLRSVRICRPTPEVAEERRIPAAGMRLRRA